MCARTAGDVAETAATAAIRSTKVRAGCDAALAQHFKGGGGAVTDEVTINIKQNLTIFAFQDAVAHQDIVEHRQGFTCGMLNHAGDHSGRTRLWQARRLCHFHLALADGVG
jgi:hypothetical protein